MSDEITSPPGAAPGGREHGRRKFLTLLTGGALAGCAAAAGGASLVFLRPRVTYGPPSKVVLGRPGNYLPGSQVALPEAKLVLRRDGDRFCAISTVCTHLGCTVTPTESGFDCPCHGSQYDERGDVIGGPAPRALAWFRVTVAPSGELVVDEHDTVDPDTYLELRA
jgi:cytochrome b6-f complex iron-sulfur subunit